MRVFKLIVMFSDNVACIRILFTKDMFPPPSIIIMSCFDMNQDKAKPCCSIVRAGFISMIIIMLQIRRCSQNYVFSYWDVLYMRNPTSESCKSHYILKHKSLPQEILIRQTEVCEVLDLHYYFLAYIISFFNVSIPYNLPLDTFNIFNHFSCFKINID